MGVRARWALLTLAWVACAEPESARLELRVLDGRDGPPIPARVELLDEDGRAHVPPQALPLRFECFAAPLPDWAAARLSVSDRIANGPTGTEQFYLDGQGALDLPPGRYRVRVTRGIESRVAEREIELAAGQERRVEIAVERWAHLAREGWWSVDDHVHLTRRSPEEDRRAVVWMAAEDLNVANLLQMGTVDQVGVTPQHAFGDAGATRLGDTLVLAGQEHPRTHFLGHTITLGAETLVDRRDTYIAYDTTFREALERGGLPGYAHFGVGPARTGLALDAPRGLVFFLEVLQFEFPWYRDWYDLLDLGIRVAPTAGTDFPCSPVAGLPGRERFYVRLDGPPTRESFVAGLRAGRTFVTNGPLLELRVGGVGVGDELELAGPGRVPVRGRVRFDPERDDVQQVEVVVNGSLRPATVSRPAPGEVRIEAEVEIDRPSWLALRVAGDKRGETPLPAPPPAAVRWVGDRVSDFREMLDRSEAYYAGRGRVRPTAAHTAAVWIGVGGSRAPAHQRLRARQALDRLGDLEARLSDPQLPDQTLWDWFPYSDAVSEEHLRRNRPALLRAIAEARARYGEMLGD